MIKEKFSYKKRLLSFRYAFEGLKVLIVEEHNSRIHLLALILAVLAGFILQISLNEWIAVAVVSGLVISMETVNSAIENLADVVSPEKCEKIKKIKDLSAAAVLISAIAALATGLIIFLPKILAYV